MPDVVAHGVAVDEAVLRDEDLFGDARGVDLLARAQRVRLHGAPAFREGDLLLRRERRLAPEAHDEVRVEQRRDRVHRVVVERRAQVQAHDLDAQRRRERLHRVGASVHAQRQGDACYALQGSHHHRSRRRSFLKVNANLKK